MNNKKLDVVTAAVSFFSSLFVFGFLLYSYKSYLFSGILAKAISVGVTFSLPALIAFVSIHACNKLRKRTKVQLPKLASSLSIVIILLCFIAGCIGQILYSLRINKEESITVKSSDIVLMIDDSGSMLPYFSTVRSAATSFVDSLTEECRLAAGIFAARIGAFEDLTFMDSAGKEKIKKVFDTSFAGGTDLNLALEHSYNCLIAANSENSKKAVVLVTDGQADVDSWIKDNYIDNNILLYTIRINGSAGIETDDLIDFAKNTGGFDTVIEPNSDNSLSLEDLSKTFCDISDSVSVGVEDSQGLLVYDEGITVYGIMIRFMFLFLLTLFVQFLYFRSLSFILNFIATAVSTAVMTVSTTLPAMWIISAIVTAAAIFTDIAQLNIGNEESDFNV